MPSKDGDAVIDEWTEQIGDLIASGEMKASDCAAAAYDPETGKLWSSVGPDCDALFDDAGVRAVCSTAGWTCSVNPVFSLISGWNYYYVGGVTSGCSPAGAYYSHHIWSRLYWSSTYPPSSLVSSWDRSCQGSGVNYCSSSQSTYLWEGWWRVNNEHDINSGGYGKTCYTAQIRGVFP